MTLLSTKIFSVKFIHPNQFNCEASTLITALIYDSDHLTRLRIWKLGEHTVDLLERDRRLTSQRGEEKAAFSTHSSVDKALFLLPKVPSAHLLADLKLLVNSILSIS